MSSLLDVSLFQLELDDLLFQLEHSSIVVEHLMAVVPNEMLLPQLLQVELGARRTPDNLMIAGFWWFQLKLLVESSDHCWMLLCLVAHWSSPLRSSFNPFIVAPNVRGGELVWGFQRLFRSLIRVRHVRFSFYYVYLIVEPKSLDVCNHSM